MATKKQEATEAIEKSLRDLKTSLKATDCPEGGNMGNRIRNDSVNTALDGVVAILADAGLVSALALTPPSDRSDVVENAGGDGGDDGQIGG